MRPKESEEKTEEIVIDNVSIQTPPEMIKYQTEYDAIDKKLEEYLAQKYKQQIASLKYLPTDTIIRFVLGYKYIGNENYNQRLQETERWFSKYLEWHKNSDYDNITDKLTAKDVSILAPSTFVYGHDKYGHPILYDDGSRYRKGGDLSIFKHKQSGDADYETMDQFICFCLRKVRDMKQRNNKKYKLDKHKIGIYQHCAIIDLNGFSVTQFLYDRKINEYMTRRGAELSPELLHKMYIINVPWMFVKVWNIFKNFLHPVTVQKTMILGSDYIDELSKDIDIHMIPKIYGGKGKWQIKYGDSPDTFYDE